MEDYDDLVPTPEANGVLELTYRGWTLVDDVVWTMGRELLVLDISFNAITELPPELGDLMLLRELNCACNKIPEFPKQIGKLRNLELIKCNGNKLSSLPDEIGECVKLKRLILGENHLQSVPASISKLPLLEELHLPNNRLSSFPPAISVGQPLLQLIDLTNNPHLQNMIPVSLQSNTDFVRWMCAKWYAHDDESALVRICNKDYEGLIDQSRQGTKELIEGVEKLHHDRRVLADLMPRGLDRECMHLYSYCCISTGLQNCAVM